MCGLDRRFSRSTFSEDRPETFLLEMPVVGEHVGQPFAPHDIH